MTTTISRNVVFAALAIRCGVCGICGVSICHSMQWQLEKPVYACKMQLYLCKCGCMHVKHKL